ncbi:MAG: PD-(D/E)XK nuclease family protein [Chloroflexi bacterium]|nr:PD-(D/E)XK nuclease family protein [Chloroflexota bacterium]MCI0580223.1 PD-(D/E)XK nuclease family protein [Chloroflexota bacterium]MCI0643439.1 PD-(D/E)XK nuclease family protein [Chloroflexota bacterium]MCI0728681.1 PD-(D/E)XK nuclease family protein [Chloroflexota bacterium]
MKKIKSAAAYAVEWLQKDSKDKKKLPYIKPSSLAKGCLLYIAFELQEQPKPPFDARVGRILSVGTDSHRRLQRGLERACLAQEVFFEIEEYRIHGFCDGVLYIPPDKAANEAMAGFWALEFKTAAASEFDKVKAAGIPKEEHVRQAQIYLWGLDAYYQGTVPLRGAIIYYENRDTLEHAAYEVYPDPEAINDLLARVKKMLEGLEEGRLPDDFLPADHWAHRYCPYLEICEPGQRAMEWQARQPKTLPDEVLADIIARRIVAKKGAEEMKDGQKKKKSGGRSLLELAQDLEWE